MSIDPATIGQGAGGGLLIALLAFFGIKGRVDKLEEKVDALPLGYVGAAHHKTCQGATVKSLDRLHKRLDVIEDDNKGQTALLHEINGKLSKEA